MRSTRQDILLRALGISAVLVSILALSLNTALAAPTIVQDPDSPWLAFEAEDYHQLIDIDNDGITWSTISDVDASGGKAIQADVGSEFNAAGSVEAEAVFNVKFTRPDRYKVFARYKNLGDSGSHDSLWTSGDPNSSPVNPLATWFGPTPAAIVRSLGSDPNENTSGNPEYFYAFLGAAHISFDASDAGQIDEVLEFRLGIREQEAVLDRIVFADSSSPGPIDQTVGNLYTLGFQLDALTNSPIEGVVNVDVDSDGDVDGADFLAIQRTDPSLISAWETAYTGGGSLSVVSAVPEPTAGFLLLFAGLIAATNRRC